VVEKINETPIDGSFMHVHRWIVKVIKRNIEKGGKDGEVFPASHKVMFRARSILDLATGKHIKGDKTWPWKDMKMAPASFTPSGHAAVGSKRW